jgi:hypothetical protein
MDSYTRRDSQGSVDIQASAQAYSEALEVWVSENEIPVDGIASVVDAILDGAAPSRVPMPTIANMAAGELGATTKTHQAVADRVHSYLQGQVKAGNLFVQLGRGGGVAKEPAVKKAKKA